MIELTDIKRLEIRTGRWSVSIDVLLESGEKQSFVASADSGITYGSGIFFGTAQEYAEEAARVW